MLMNTNAQPMSRYAPSIIREGVFFGSILLIALLTVSVAQAQVPVTDATVIANTQEANTKLDSIMNDYMQYIKQHTQDSAQNTGRLLNQSQQVNAAAQKLNDVLKAQQDAFNKEIGKRLATETNRKDGDPNDVTNNPYCPDFVLCGNGALFGFEKLYHPCYPVAISQADKPYVQALAAQYTQNLGLDSGGGSMSSGWVADGIYLRSVASDDYDFFSSRQARSGRTMMAVVYNDTSYDPVYGDGGASQRKTEQGTSLGDEMQALANAAASTSSGGTDDIADEGVDTQQTNSTTSSASFYFAGENFDPNSGQKVSDYMKLAKGSNVGYSDSTDLKHPLPQSAFTAFPFLSQNDDGNGSITSLSGGTANTKDTSKSDYVLIVTLTAAERRNYQNDMDMATQRLYQNQRDLKFALAAKQYNLRMLNCVKSLGDGVKDLASNANTSQGNVTYDGDAKFTADTVALPEQSMLQERLMDQARQTITRVDQCDKNIADAKRERMTLMKDIDSTIEKYENELDREAQDRANAIFGRASLLNRAYQTAQANGGSTSNMDSDTQQALAAIDSAKKTKSLLGKIGSFTDKTGILNLESDIQLGDLQSMLSDVNTDVSLGSGGTSLINQKLKVRVLGSLTDLSVNSGGSLINNTTTVEIGNMRNQANIGTGSLVDTSETISLGNMTNSVNANVKPLLVGSVDLSALNSSSTSNLTSTPVQYIIKDDGSTSSSPVSWLSTFGNGIFTTSASSGSSGSSAQILNGSTGTSDGSGNTYNGGDVSMTVNNSTGDTTVGGTSSSSTGSSSDTWGSVSGSTDISTLQNQVNTIQGQINALQASGQPVPASLYTQLGEAQAALAQTSGQ